MIDNHVVVAGMGAPGATASLSSRGEALLRSTTLLDKPAAARREVFVNPCTRLRGAPCRAAVAWIVFLAVGVLAPLPCLAAPIPAPNWLSPAEIAAGWLLLFDGQTLFGWQKNADADWRVSGGAIAATRGKQGLLTTTSQFANYVLKVDFRASPETNSGLFLRTPAQPTDPAVDCYELNIAAPSLSPFPTGSLVDRQKASAVAAADTAWHSYEVTALGNNFTVLLDGQRVLDHQTPPEKAASRPRLGFIGLQFRAGPVEFRNIKLQPLGLKSIFNGRDLSGWRVAPGHASVFSVVAAAAPKTDGAGATTEVAEASDASDGVLTVKNGNGALESDEKYADFIMQLDVFSSGKGLNSGIFFRSIPGEFWQGYECQINNAMKNDDRSLPKDFGTGAIYRREPARRIVADDFAWFTLTLTAAGPHMATWVNGYPVTDWTDRRKADKNGRNGLRTEAGTLQIQGHDPTTDLSFRRLRIVELPVK